MADATSTQEQAKSPIRQLVINLVFSLFVSIAVFSIASYFFLVPYMFEQKLQLDSMAEKVRALDARAAEQAAADADEAPADEAQAAAPAEPAPANEGAAAAAATP